MAKNDQEQIWSARYGAAGEEYLFGTAPNAFLQGQAFRLQPGLTALSVADGEGRNSVWLAQEGLVVTAVEISPVALHKAHRLAESRCTEVNFIQADLLAWDWPPASFDVAVAIFIQFVGPAEREILFARLRDTLKPGGLLLMQGYTPKQLDYGTGGPSAIENLYTEELLSGAFQDFEFLELRSHEAQLDEGFAHRGQSALVDLVVRKPR